MNNPVTDLTISSVVWGQGDEIMESNVLFLKLPVELMHAYFILSGKATWCALSVSKVHFVIKK